MTLPSALQPKALIEPCTKCGGKVYVAFSMRGNTNPYTLRSGVKMARALLVFHYCEDCKSLMHATSVLRRKMPNCPPIDPKVVRVLKMLLRNGWNPWERVPTQLSEV